MILDKIVEDKKVRLVEDKAGMDLKSVRRIAEEMTRDDSISTGRFFRNLKKEGISGSSRMRRPRLV